MKKTNVPMARGRAVTVERLLESALGLIADEGVEAVTHRAVAKRAEVSLGSVTHHFPTRQALLQGAFRFHAARSFRLISGLEAELRPESLEALQRFLLELVRRELEEPWRIVTEYELLVRAARDPVVAAEARTYQEGLVARLGDALERFGVLRPFEAARTLVGVVRGFEVERLLSADLQLAQLDRRLSLVRQALRAHP